MDVGKSSFISSDKAKNFCSLPSGKEKLGITVGYITIARLFWFFFLDETNGYVYNSKNNGELHQKQKNGEFHSQKRKKKTMEKVSEDRVPNLILNIFLTYEGQLTICLQKEKKKQLTIY